MSGHRPAQHEVAGRERVGVTEGTHRDVLGGPRSDSGERGQRATAPVRVLSGIEPPDLVRAIRQADLGRLTRIPGVGKKTAERLVLEMKDRLPAVVADEPEAPVEGGDVRDDVLSALANLGYQRAAAEKAVDGVRKRSPQADFEPLLREVLRELAQ